MLQVKNRSCGRDDIAGGTEFDAENTPALPWLWQNFDRWCSCADKTDSNAYGNEPFNLRRICYYSELNYFSKTRYPGRIYNLQAALRLDIIPVNAWHHKRKCGQCSPDCGFLPPLLLHLMQTCQWFQNWRQQKRVVNITDFYSRLNKPHLLAKDEWDRILLRLVDQPMPFQSFYKIIPSVMEDDIIQVWMWPLVLNWIMTKSVMFDSPFGGMAATPIFALVTAEQSFWLAKALRWTSVNASHWESKEAN